VVVVVVASVVVVVVVVVVVLGDVVVGGGGSRLHAASQQQIRATAEFGTALHVLSEPSYCTPCGGKPGMNAGFSGAG
jgi:hypothetical protein